MHHRPLEAVLGDRALEFVSRCLGVGRRQSGKTGEPVRVRRDGIGQAVVDAGRQRDGGFRIEALGRRRAVGQHLDIDPGIVHFLEPQRTQIFQLVAQGRRSAVAAREMRF